MLTETIEVNDFKKIKVSGGFEVLLKKGGTPSIQLTIDENLRDYLDIGVAGETLEISTREKIVSQEGIELVITYTELIGIEAGGATSVKNEGVLAGDIFKVSLSGAGAVEMKLDVKALNADVSGAGAVELWGKADEQIIKMDGAGGFDASELVGKNCKVSISGVGGASVHATEKLDAKVSGVGGIRYRGNPKDIKTDISGVGSVDPEE